MDGYVVGVDLGRTKTAVGLIDPQDRIVAQRRLPTYAREGPGAVVEQVASTVAHFQGDLPSGERIRALGICTPGPVDHTTGTVLEPHDLQGLHNAPLRQMLADRLGVPVSLDHDAKSAALGEFHYGAGCKSPALVYVVVGTGVGAAIVVDGQVFRGVRDLAGEVGHITLDRNGEPCACGSRGCVETHLSGPWLGRRYIHALKRTGGRQFNQAASGEMVTQLANQGDAMALQVLREAGEALGLAISIMAMILNIDLYVIGGSVSNAGELLLQPARQIVKQFSFPSINSGVRILASMKGDDAPILGCGWQARTLAH
jgi:glucokinase